MAIRFEPIKPSTAHVLAVATKPKPVATHGVIVATELEPAKGKKRLLSLRVDEDVIEAFKATGKGWQSRMNDALRNAIAKG